MTKDKFLKLKKGDKVKFIRNGQLFETIVLGHNSPGSICIRKPGNKNVEYITEPSTFLDEEEISSKVVE